MSVRDYGPLHKEGTYGFVGTLMKRVQQETESMQRQKEIAVTRAYLRFLEQGYSAKDLVLHETPMQLVETEPNVFCIQQGVTLRHKNEAYFGREPVDAACEKAREANDK